MEADMTEATAPPARPVPAAVPEAARGAGEVGEAHAVSGADSAVLHAIRRPGVTLAVWRRTVPAALAAFVDGVSDMPSQVRCTVRPTGAAPGLAAALAPVLPGPDFGQRLLVNDLARLVRLFADATGAWSVAVRLERLDTDACRMFHADFVGIRLLCTYAGPGTQWVPNRSAVRAALGSGDNAAICPRPEAIQALPRFAVGLFKGDAWPGNRGNGIVHRSPPVAGTGRTRLLACLDTAE
jgi:hypothetical protein